MIYGKTAVARLLLLSRAREANALAAETGALTSDLSLD